MLNEEHRFGIDGHKAIITLMIDGFGEVIILATDQHPTPDDAKRELIRNVFYLAELIKIHPQSHTLPLPTPNTEAELEAMYIQGDGWVCEFVNEIVRWIQGDFQEPLKFSEVINGAIKESCTYLCAFNIDTLQYRLAQRRKTK